MVHKFIVENLKIRLDKYLAEQVKDASRSQIQRDIEAGQVAVNGKKIVISHFAVRKGDEIEYQAASSKNQGEKLTAVNIPLKVLYDNHGLMIIDKPAGLPMHPGAGFKGATLASALLYHDQNIKFVGEEDRPGVVHRLDKDTSGVVLVAKTQEMYEYLKEAFAEKKIKKEYLALVFGRLALSHGIIDTSVGKSKRDFRKYDVTDVLQSKSALTEYKVLEYLTFPPHPSAWGGHLLPQGEREIMSGEAVDSLTLLLVKLHTGRTHQIRVHFNSLGHPVMGDKLYGGKRAQLPGLNRQFLHAKKIEVRLPFDSAQGQGPDGTWIEAESQLPEDLRKVLKGLKSEMANEL